MKFMDRFLRRIPSYLCGPLIIPFYFLAIVCLVLARAIQSWSGILTNLAATFIGILITVLYVEYILRKHEEQRWAPAKALISKNVSNFAIVSSAMFRVVFGMGSDIFNSAVIDVNDPQSLRLEMIRALQENVLPSVDEGVHKMSNAKWKTLAIHFELVQERGDRLLQQYSARMSPEMLGHVMSLQDEIATLVGINGWLSDVIGSPWAGPKGLEDRALEKFIGSGIKRVCEASIALMRELDSPLPG